MPLAITCHPPLSELAADILGMTCKAIVVDLFRCLEHSVDLVICVIEQARKGLVRMLLEEDKHGSAG